MSQLKGSQHRIIKPPGYHIKSKYDLEGLRHLKMGGHHRELDVELPLTSMIDMFSMLVIFLLINFSSSGDVFFIDRKILLPNAENAKPLENNPLISITKDSVIFDAHEVGTNPLHVQEPNGNQDFPQLRELLRKIKRTHEAIHPKEPFKGNINIQADQSTPVIYVKRVMATLITEGFTGINFATKKREPAGGHSSH